MSDRIRTYLKNLDILRDESAEEVDKLLKKINLDILLSNPEKALKLAILNYLKDNSELFKKARNEGQKLAASL